LPDSMSSIRKAFWLAARGPLTSLKLVLMAATTTIGGALAVSVTYAPLQRYVVPIALAFGLALLLLCVVLLTLVLAKLNETMASVALEGALRRLGLESPDFFTDGAAGTPSLDLLLVKVLRLIRPARILEFGSGQTTKLFALYHHATPSSYVLTLEEDPSWMR